MSFYQFIIFISNVVQFHIFCYLCLLNKNDHNDLNFNVILDNTQFNNKSSDRDYKMIKIDLFEKVKAMKTQVETMSLYIETQICVLLEIWKSIIILEG